MTKIIGKIEDRKIFVDDVELLPDLSQKIYNHSPDGFDWGYGGSGPAQLALALLLRFYKKELALTLYQDLKWDFVAQLPQEDFEMEFDIEGWVERKKKELKMA